MARHDQKPPRAVCSNCRNGNCEGCVDVLRSVYTDDKLCDCRRKNHTGEPMSQQILDPETGTVHAPGLTVDSDGKVEFK